MPNRSTDEITNHWPKEHSRRGAVLRQRLAWTEASRWHELDEPLADAAITEAAEYRIELEAVAADSTSWRRIPKEQFQLLAFQQIMAFGCDEDQDRITRLMSLYPVIEARLTIGERLRMIEQVAGFVARYRLPFGRVFNPFLYLEQDDSVFTTALMTFVSYFDEPGDDSTMTGPEAVLALLSTFLPRRQGLTISTLLLLGDQRLLPLLDGIWRRLDGEATLALTRNRTGFMYVAVAEFYLRWLEDIDESAYGVPAAGLVQMRRSAIHPVVMDVERDLPVRDPATNPIRTIREWTIAEFATEIEPRLRTLLAKEGEEQVIPFVLQEWGLDWTPASEAEAAAHARSRQILQRPAPGPLGRPSA